MDLPDNKFVVRLMEMKCTFGCMEHPINVATENGGHGIVVGDDEQPLMNANDFLNEVHIMHFGDCSAYNAFTKQDVFEKEDSDGFWESLGKTAGNFLVKGAAHVGSFLTSRKCFPQTETVWAEGDQQFIVEGAPVMLVKSKLACRCGGIIELVRVIPDPESDENAESDIAEEASVAEAAAQQLNNAIENGAFGGNQEIADFTNKGFSAALDYANGDVEKANELFLQLARYGVAPKFGEDTTGWSDLAGPIDKGFILYLKRNQSSLLYDCQKDMTYQTADETTMSFRTMLINAAVNKNNNTSGMDMSLKIKYTDEEIYAMDFINEPYLSPEVDHGSQLGLGLKDTPKVPINTLLAGLKS